MSSSSSSSSCSSSSSPSTVSATSPGVSALVARDLVRTFTTRPVLDGIDLLAAPGQPVGLVGENGAGKSTLLRILAGLDAADAGQVTRPGDTAYLGQEPDLATGTTVGDVLGTVLAPLHEATRRLEVLGSQMGEGGAAAARAADEFGALLAWAEQHDAWDADRRAEVTAARLGVGHLPADRPVGELSGGERTRLALAAIIVRRPDCVLLDEPTNHLDDEAMAHVEEFLTSCAGPVVVASHDRVFLDRVAAVIVDLDPVGPGMDGRSGEGRGARFTGGFSDYRQERHRARGRWEEAYAAWREEMNGLRDQLGSTARSVAHGRGPRDNDKFIHHFKGANVERTQARRVRNVERRIETLERERVPKPPRPLRLDLPPTRGAGTLSVRDLVVPGRVRLPRLDVEAGGHLLVSGANGTGKSTLLAVLAGELAAPVGEVRVQAQVLGHLPQDVVFDDPDRTARELYAAAAAPSVTTPVTTPDLGAVPPLRDLGLLHPRDLQRPVGDLSVGQQRRLGLALVLARRPDLLLLDEPTNHLSLALAGELEEAVGASPGTVVVTSHDRWLRRRWQGSVLTL